MPIKKALAYWAETFDWRAQEVALNRFDHYRARIDGTLVHFVYKRSASGGGIPLILTHGWPSTFIEFLPMAALVTNPPSEAPSLDVVIPSLPGYGFSERPYRTGINYRFVARLWHLLMCGLGYHRYGAHGGDFGAGVTTFMALDEPEHMIGILLSTLENAPYLGARSRALSEAE